MNAALVAAAGITAVAVFFFLIESDGLSEIHARVRTQLLNTTRWAFVIALVWLLIPATFTEPSSGRPVVIVGMVGLAAALMLIPVKWLIRIGGREPIWELRSARLEVAKLANRIRREPASIPADRISETISRVELLRTPALARAVRPDAGRAGRPPGRLRAMDRGRPALDTARRAEPSAVARGRAAARLRPGRSHVPLAVLPDVRAAHGARLRRAHSRLGQRVPASARFAEPVPPPGHEGPDLRCAALREPVAQGPGPARLDRGLRLHAARAQRPRRSPRRCGAATPRSGAPGSTTRTCERSSGTWLGAASRRRVRATRLPLPRRLPATPRPRRPMRRPRPRRPSVGGFYEARAIAELSGPRSVDLSPLAESGSACRRRRRD